MVDERQQQIESSRQQAQQSIRNLEVQKSKVPDYQSQQALRERMTGLAGRAARRKLGAVSESVSGKISGVKGQVSSYETDIAKYEPQYAKEEYVEKVYAPAKQKIQSQFDKAKVNLDKLNNRWEDSKNTESFNRSSSSYRNDKQNQYQLDKAALQAELKVLGGALASDKKTLVKNYYSGYTQSKVNSEVGYASQVRLSSIRAKAEQKKAETEFSVTSTKVAPTYIQFGTTSKVDKRSIVESPTKTNVATIDNKLSFDYATGAVTIKNKELTTSNGMEKLTPNQFIQLATTQRSTKSVLRNEPIPTSKVIPAVGVSSIILDKSNQFNVRGTQDTKILGIGEQAKIDEIQYKSDLSVAALTGVPAQLAGGIFTTSMSESDREKVTGVNYFNPKNQYDVFKSSFDYNRNIPKAEEIGSKLDTLNKDYAATESEMSTRLVNLKGSNIVDGEWTGSEKDLIKYNALVSDYNKQSEIYKTKFEGISNNKAYQNVISSGERRNVYQRLADTTLSGSKRFGVSAGVTALDFGTYLVPGVRVIRGADLTSRGVVELSRATTQREIIAGSLQTGGGLFLAGTGLKGSSLLPRTAAKGTVGNVIKTGLSWGIPTAISGAYGYSVYKQTGDIAIGAGAAVGGFLGLKSPEIYRGTKAVVKAGIKGYRKEFSRLYLDKKAKAGSSSKTKQVQVQKKKLTPKEVKKKLQDIANEHGEKPNFATVRKYIDELVKIGDKAALTRYYEFLKGLYGKGKADELMMEYFAQEGIGIGIATPSSNVRVGSITTTRGSQISAGRGSQISANKDYLVAGQQILTSEKVMQVQKSKTQQLQLISPAIKSAQGTSQVSSLDTSTVQKSAVVSQSMTAQSPKIEEQVKSLEKMPKPQLRGGKKVLKPSRKIRKPKKRINILPIPTSDLRKAVSQVKKIVKKEKFGVFVRKSGKDISIGKYSSVGEAKSKLRRTLSETLRASGYVTKGKKKLKAKSLGLFGGSFTASKVDKFRVVEKKERRLKKGTQETVDIIGFRKTGKKKKSKRSLFRI